MPPPVDFTAKAAVSLFQLLQKVVDGISLSSRDSKTLDTEFALYMEHYWQEVYGDTRTLLGMKDLEERPLDPEAFDHLHKATRLPLKWDAEDTSQATACAEKLTKMMRDSENNDTATALKNCNYLPCMTVEVRYRCALESRPQKSAPRRGKSVNLTCAQIL